MNLKDKNILLISPEPWDHIFVSKHHYAIHLGRRGNRIFFLNSPGPSDQVIATGYQNVWTVHYRGFPKGMRFYPRFLRGLFTAKKFKELQKLCGVEFDIVWSFDNSVFYDFSSLPSKVFSISHIVDFSQDYQFVRACASATVCIGVSQNIVDRQLKLNPRSFKITHGLSVNKGNQLKVQLPGTSKIKVLYAGNLDSCYLDVDLMSQLIKHHSDIDFVFLGPGGANWPKRNNVYLVGRVDQDLLPGYLDEADVLLLLYNSNKYPQQLTNAHKILEYLSVGKVIVSTPIADYKGNDDLLVIAEHNDLASVFRSVISDLNFYNSAERMSIRKQFAFNNTYDHRIQEIEAHLEKN